MTLQQKVSGAFVPVGGGGAPAEDWVRPADWLTLPTVTAGEQKFVGLVAVWPSDSNWVSLIITSAYTVDWGDGTAAENVASGVRATRNLLWANMSSATLTTLGYRQALVTVTMQGAANMATLTLDTRSSNTVNGASSLWLDIKMASANLTSLIASGATALSAALQRFEYVGPSAITSTAPSFLDARALRKVVGSAWTAGCTKFSSTFSSCTSLRMVPTLDTSAGIEFDNMFIGCTSLIDVPVGAIDTSAGTKFNSMFSACKSLVVVATAALDTSGGTALSSIFNGCTSLVVAPTLDASAGTSSTSYTGMFGGCLSLQVGALSGTKFTISYANCALSATELDAIYNGLATVVGQTITVSGNWGTAGDTPSIATAKGWTVTG